MSCKKIAIMTPFLAQGGLEKVAYLQARELSKVYDVTLIVMDSFQIDYPYEGKVIDLDISLHHRGILSRVYNITKAIIKLYRLKKQHKFELVISHGELANLPNILSMGKCLVVVHGDRFAHMTLKDRQSRYVSKIIKRIYSFKNVSKIVTVSEGIRDSFIKILKIPISCIVTLHNPFDLKHIERLSQESLKEYEALFSSDVLITVGRLNNLKGQWYLLRIFKKLKQKNSELKLLILGDGEMRDELLALSNDLGLLTFSIWSKNSLDMNADVYFLGFQKNPFNFLSAASIFALTSLSEGFGNVIVEAMASQTPVVSSDCRSGPREIMYPELKVPLSSQQVLVDGYGVLLPPFDNKFVGALEDIDNKESLWVETLQLILKNKDNISYYKKAGVDRANDFNIKSVMDKWESLIDDILDEKT